MRHLRQQVVHQLLKRLRCVFQPEGYVQIFVQAKQGDDRNLWHISISNRYLVVALDQVKSAEDMAAGQLVPQVLHVGQGIPVWGGDVVEAPVVPSWLPCAVRLLHHVKRGGPGTV